MNIDTTTAEQIEPSPIESRGYIMGIDPSFGGPDNFIVQVWRFYQGRYSLSAEYAQSGFSKTINIQRTIDLIDKYRPLNANIKTNGGGIDVLEELIKKRPDIRWGKILKTMRSKIDNTDRIVLMLAQGLLEFPSRFPEDSVVAASIAFAGMDEWGELVNNVSAQEGILG